jgi:hypothetical protein
MHPNAYLRTFWQLDLKPQVFVAMSFGEEYRARYEQVIAPAISGILIGGSALVPHRVDNSKTGDSILTDIIDGVAHSRMVLADVSSIGRDSKTGHPYRNGNVMYEVGIALACRQPADVLLLRDDADKFLFDVSTVPHMHLDFVDVGKARLALQAELIARLGEQNYVADARVRLAVASLSNQELILLSELEATPEDQIRGWNVGGTVLSTYEAAVMRLLDKRLVTLAGQFPEGYAGYRLTQLGRVVAEHVKSGLPQVQPRANPVQADPQLKQS